MNRIEMLWWDTCGLVVFQRQLAPVLKYIWKKHSLNFSVEIRLDCLSQPIWAGEAWFYQSIRVWNLF